MNITLSKNDEIVMKLIHYFITIKGYSPIVLHGAKDEIWLENNEEDYQIVRIVTNYIHNNEQLDFDIYRTKEIMKRIKKKTFSINMIALSIFVNLGENVNIKNADYKNVDLAYLKSFKDVSKYQFINEKFPDILKHETTEEKGLELFVKITEEINKKNSEEAKKAEDVFKKKLPIVTYTLMAINIIMFVLLVLEDMNVFEINAKTLYNYGGLVNYKTMTDISSMYRIITSMFLHGGIIHLAFNIYALYILGTQLESFYGKIKFTIIYLVSGIVGNLFAMLFLSDGVVSIGASGAIFGLLGAILYFGYHYRLYLGEVLKTQIIPLIIINLVLGLLISDINISAHIGGLIGGYFISKAVGVKYKSTSFDIINGVIMLIILVTFLAYMILGR